MPAAGKFLTGTATTDATAGATADVTFTVPSGYRYLFDFATVSVDATNNKVRIYNTIGGTEYQIWEELTDVTTETEIDFATRYPRSIQVESGEKIIFRVETTEAVAKTLTVKLWVIQGG